MDMSNMEQGVLDVGMEVHKAIVAAVADLDRLGYQVQRIKGDSGKLEITCRPPRKKEGGKED